MLKKVIISGGGTGGHIFPALAIANELRARYPKVKILFVGAEGKMEMEKVPAAGYPIVGLKIVGLKRKLSLSNLLLPFKLLKSLRKARSILKSFKPEVVIGVGGYASGPVLQMATMLRIPTMVQEQNSFPGKTNRILSRKVTAICTAYEGLEKFFPAKKIHFTGNPVRLELKSLAVTREEAFACFPKLDPAKKTILVIGGSLGSRMLNESVLFAQDRFAEEGVQVLWQCGKHYFEVMKMEAYRLNNPAIELTDFIARMDAAYKIADVIISRAGALSISELCLIGKPVILVPSPNVSEDHQTKNAMTLVNSNAALMIKDREAKEKVMQTAFDLMKDHATCAMLSSQIASLAKPGATIDIVNVIETLKRD